MTLQAMWEEFNGDNDLQYMEDLYADWESQTDVKLPPFPEFDEECNNKAISFPKFIEFFTLYENCNITVPSVFLKLPGIRTTVNVSYCYNLEKDLTILSVFARWHHTRNIYWTDEFFNFIKTYCYAFQFPS